MTDSPLRSESIDYVRTGPPRPPQVPVFIVPTVEAMGFVSRSVVVFRTQEKADAFVAERRATTFGRHSRVRVHYVPSDVADKDLWSWGLRLEYGRVVRVVS